MPDDRDQMDKAYKDNGDPSRGYTNLGDASRGYMDAGQMKAFESHARQKLSDHAARILRAQQDIKNPPTAPPEPRVTETVQKFNSQPVIFADSVKQAFIPSAGSGSGIITPSAWGLVSIADSSGDLLLGVNFRSILKIDGKPNNFFSVSNLLSSDFPSPSDTGFFAISGATVIFLELDLNAPGDWITMGPVSTASIVVDNTNAPDLPGGGQCEMVYTAASGSTPASGVGTISRVKLGTVYNDSGTAVVIQESIAQLTINTGVRLCYDATATDSLYITTAWAAPA